MFRTIASNVWAFDLEWVPCPESGRRVYDLSLIHISEPTRPY